MELKEKYGAFLVLDESISLGTLGASGRGLFDAAGVDISRIDAVIGSLEHAVAGVGGYCAGRKVGGVLGSLAVWSGLCSIGRSIGRRRLQVRSGRIFEHPPENWLSELGLPCRIG